MKLNDQQIAKLTSYLNENEVRNFIEGLCAFPHRFNHKIPHLYVKQAVDYTVDRLKGIGVKDIDIIYYPRISGWWCEDSYFDLLGWRPLDIWTIVATIHGAANDNNCVYVTAHLDSYTYATDNYSDPKTLGDPFAPGADDNGTGVAAIYEIIKAIIATGYKPDYTIKFVIFSAEEWGKIDSDLYVSNLYADGEKVKLNINADMIGNSPSAQWKMKLHYYDTDTGYLIRERCMQLIQQYTHIEPNYGLLNKPSSDSASFWNYGYKAIFFQEYDMSAYYHTADDKIDNLNLPYLMEMIKGMMICVAEFAGLKSGRDIITVHIDQSETLKAKAIKAYDNESETKSADYIIN